jgi:hypothetical protein
MACSTSNGHLSAFFHLQYPYSITWLNPCHLSPSLLPLPLLLLLLQGLCSTVPTVASASPRMGSTWAWQ